MTGPIPIGSGIAKALGGRIGLRSGSGPGPGGQGARRQATSNPGRSSGPSGPGPGGQGARGQATQNPGRSSRPSGPPGGGDRAMTYTAPVNRHTGPTNQEALLVGQKKKEMRDLIAQQQAEKRDVFQRPGPKLGGLKNWAANYGGANVGASLASMLFGGGLPSLILGTLFGGRTSRNLMNPKYRGSRLQDRLRNIFAFKNDYIPGQRTDSTGIETIDPSLLINDPSDPGYLWRMMQKQKEEERLAALASQRITQQDLMGMV